MEAKRMALDPAPPRPAHAELNQKISFPGGEAAALADDILHTSHVSLSDFELSGAPAEDVAGDLSGLSLTSSPTHGPEGRPRRSDIQKVAPIARSSVSVPKPVVPPSEEYDLANQWASLHKSAHVAGAEIPLAVLRAYHLWHEQLYEVPEICGILRDPPLKHSTVIDYLCEAVLQGSLPAIPERMANIGGLGVLPHRYTHQEMLRCAKEESERRMSMTVDERKKQGDVGWWGISGR